ncbi:putative cyclin-B3-1 isoform X2 [Punica granatum]|uniref:Cyclin-B3-1 isoform X2 n=1 Tax=Punica granatum TaxID=22663 RepID=A0A6P8DID6_PUNGR|nr:putative cyclin-B3-1 isoform X2 [Punica granatum]
MARGKAKVDAGMSSVTGDPLARKNAGPTKFKVYSERGKLKTDAAADSLRKSVAATKGTTQPGLTIGPKNMEKIKGLRDSSVKTNVRRKALADVSNIRKIGSSGVACDGSKPMKYKSDRITSIKRESIDPGVRTASALPRKSITAQAQGRLSQGTGEPCPLKRDMKELVASSNAQSTKTKETCGGSTFTDNRRSRINSLALPRKILPVLRRNNQENSDSSDKGKGKTAIAIKAKSGKKMLPQLSNTGSHIAKNRPSDGHIMTVPKGQRNIATHASSGIPTTRTGNIARVVPNIQTTIKTKHLPAADKSSSVPAVSSGTDKPETNPVPEDIASTVSQENKRQEIPSGETSLLEENKEKAIVKGKAGRRRSYTSLLMARSKFLGEHGEVVKQENVPNIDDGSNQLEVAEYVDEIYEYYWITEAQFSSLANYMSIQGDVTSPMRGILINWLIEVHLKFDLMHETLYLMVTLLDRYLSQVPIQKNEMQLVGLAALLLASKYEDFWHPRIKDLISVSAESYTREQMLRMESSILKKLKFRLNIPTPYVFMLRFLKAAQSDKVLEHLAFYLIELSLVEYEALEFRSSLLCASAIYVARLTLQISPTWTPLLMKHARYEVPHMRECAEMILRFHKAARKGQLKVTYEKYAGPDLSGVAMIRPLEKLPA